MATFRTDDVTTTFEFIDVMNWNEKLRT